MPFYSYTRSGQIYVCPDDTTGYAVSYLSNNYTSLLAAAAITDTASLVLATDGNEGPATPAAKNTVASSTTGNGLNEDYSIYCQSYRIANASLGTPRHANRTNFLFCDGHVKISPLIYAVANPSGAQVDTSIPYATYISPTTGGVSTCAATVWQ